MHAACWEVLRKNQFAVEQEVSQERALDPPRPTVLRFEKRRHLQVASELSLCCVVGALSSGVAVVA